MKILLATDGTKHGEAALDTIGVLNLTAGDEIKIISIVDMAVPLAVDMYAGYLASTTEIEKAMRENAEKVVDSAIEKARGMVGSPEVSVSGAVSTGSPESRIVETAEEFGADLVIVGSHGYNRWERLLLGSVSDSVVHHAPCSVLVVRK